MEQIGWPGVREWEGKRWMERFKLNESSKGRSDDDDGVFAGDHGVCVSIRRFKG